MKRSKRECFKGVRVGEEEVLVSHLQYADDTIFFGDWGGGNVRNLICILKCFEKVSGLRANMTKSRLYGIEVPMRDVVVWLGE